MLSILKQDIKKLYGNLKRNIFLNKLNNLSSEIHVNNDKVIFYIDEYYFKKDFKNQDEYNVILYRISNLKNITSEEYNKMIYDYKLNKNFIYIFEGIIFDKKIILNANEKATVIFKNCTFKEGIEIRKCYNLIFNKNKYYCHGCYDIVRKQAFITGKDIENIQFINEKFLNSDYSHHPTPHFGINLEATNIEFNNSTVNTDSSIKIEDKVYRLDKQSEITLKSKYLKIINTELNSPNIYIESDIISIDRSNIKATNGIVIETKKMDTDIEKLDTPYLLYNREELIKKTKTKPFILLKKLKNKL